MNDLTPELWEKILVIAGPLALAPSVRVCSRYIAACRIQNAMRASWMRRPPLPRDVGCTLILTYEDFGLESLGI